jgi:hypothetical protein
MEKTKMDTEDLKFIIDKIDDVRDELNGKFDKLLEQNSRKFDEVLKRLDEKANCDHTHPSYVSKQDFFEQFVAAEEKLTEKKDNHYIRKSNKITLTINLLKSLTPFIIIILLIIYTVLRSSGQVPDVGIIR